MSNKFNVYLYNAEVVKVFEYYSQYFDEPNDLQYYWAGAAYAA